MEFCIKLTKKKYKIYKTTTLHLAERKLRKELILRNIVNWSSLSAQLYFPFISYSNMYRTIGSSSKEENDGYILKL